MFYQVLIAAFTVIFATAISAVVIERRKRKQRTAGHLQWLTETIEAEARRTSE